MEQHPPITSSVRAGADLADTKGWIGKLDALGHLVEKNLPARFVMPIDAILAEIVNATTTPNELTGPEHADRLTQIRALVQTSTPGTGYEPPANRASDGIRALQLADRPGSLPSDPQHDRAPGDLRVDQSGAAESGTGAVGISGSDAASSDGAFPEDPASRRRHRDAGDAGTSALPLINPESVAEAIGQCRLPSEKVRTLVRIVDLMPYVASKAKTTEFVRAAWSPDDLVRESGGKDRPAALPVLVGMHRDVSGADMDAETKARLLADLDTTLLDIVRTDVLNAPNRSFMDRILQLMKLCAASPLPEGKARACAVEAVGRAVNSPEFLEPFMKRFKAEAERKQALLSLRNLLKTSGLASRVILKGDKFALIVMPRLDLGISRRKAIIPAPERDWNTHGEEWVPLRK